MSSRTSRGGSGRWIWTDPRTDRTPAALLPGDRSGMRRRRAPGSGSLRLRSSTAPSCWYALSVLVRASRPTASRTRGRSLEAMAFEAPGARRGRWWRSATQCDAPTASRPSLARRRPDEPRRSAPCPPPTTPSSTRSSSSAVGRRSGRRDPNDRSRDGGRAAPRARPARRRSPAIWPDRRLADSPGVSSPIEFPAAGLSDGVVTVRLMADADVPAVVEACPRPRRAALHDRARPLWRVRRAPLAARARGPGSNRHRPGDRDRRRARASG